MSKGHLYFLISFIITISIAVYLYLFTHNPWIFSSVILLSLIITTILLLMHAFLNKIKVDEVPNWIPNARNLGEQTQMVREHYFRIVGTLAYWKNQAAAHYRLHLSRVFWSILSSILLPVLIHLYDTTQIWSKIFMTILTAWTGLIISLAYTLKSEQKYQGFRQIESDFYDRARKLLDEADLKSASLQDEVQLYFKDVETIRQMARKIETDSPPSAFDFPKHSQLPNVDLPKIVQPTSVSNTIHQDLGQKICNVETCPQLEAASHTIQILREEINSYNMNMNTLITENNKNVCDLETVSKQNSEDILLIIEQLTSSSEKELSFDTINAIEEKLKNIGSRIDKMIRGWKGKESNPA